MQCRCPSPDCEAFGLGDGSDQEQWFWDMYAQANRPDDWWLYE